MLQDISFSTKCLIFTGAILCCFLFDFFYFIIIAFKIAKFRITISLEKYTYILKIRKIEFINISFSMFVSIFPKKHSVVQKLEKKKIMAK